MSDSAPWQKWRSLLDRPLTDFWRVMGWAGSSLVFFLLCKLLGGPSEGDAVETVYGTWAIAHGNLACVYPPVSNYHFNELANPFALAAPLYQWLAGGLAALFRFGQSSPFPTAAQMGPHCSNAFLAMYNWSASTDVIIKTINLSYLTWLAVMAGAVMLLAASGRGRRGWEPLALILLACTSPLLMCITYYLHPEDLLAMGLILAAVACVLRKKWLAVGILLGLAFCAQQFTLLVAGPLLVIADTRDRVRLVVAAAITIVAVDGPLIVATSGRAVRMVLLGSSRAGSSIRSTGGTVLWETHLGGPALFLVARVLPIVAALILAWWLARRLGARLLTPVTLMSLVATSLLLRLVFEENLFGYYFMAGAVSLILLDVVAGALRGELLAWLGLVTVAFNPVHLNFESNLTSWAFNLSYAIPIVIFAIGLAAVAYDVYRRRFLLYKWVWLLVVALTAESKIYGQSHPVFIAPNWLWQVVLVPIALWLAFRPLREALVNRAVPQASLSGSLN